jgi:hypothetical protein
MIRLSAWLRKNFDLIGLYISLMIAVAAFTLDSDSYPPYGIPEWVWSTAFIIGFFGGIIFTIISLLRRST